MTMHYAKCFECYKGIYGLLETFWMAIFAGQSFRLDTTWQVPKSPYGDFTQWLPETTLQWKSQSPPMTPMTAGLVELDEVDIVINQVSSGFDWGSVTNQSAGSFDWKSSWISYEDFDPEKWPENENEQYEELTTFSDMWHQQPYDLCHRLSRFCI